jgi:hypothetical protein
LKNTVVILPTQDTFVDIAASAFGQAVAAVALGVVQGHTNSRTSEYILSVIDNHIHSHPIRNFDDLVVTREPKDKTRFPA